MLNEIRPTRHKLIQTSLLLQDINELLDRDFDDISSCPACNSSKRKNKFKKYDLNFVQCDICSTIYMNPRPSKKSMDIYYQTSRNYKYWAEKIFPSSSDARTEMICKPSLKRIKQTLIIIYMILFYYFFIKKIFLHKKHYSDFYGLIFFIYLFCILISHLFNGYEQERMMYQFQILHIIFISNILYLNFSFEYILILSAA